MATIYKKETTRPLTNYQKRMNEAAQELCLANPGILQNRKLLLDAAQEKIIDQGFQFAKGKSRSRKGANCEDKPTPKRWKCSQTIRDQRLKDIEEDCQDLSDRISFKEKRIAACENVRDYKKCDELREEITNLKQQRRLLQMELKGIKKSNYQSQWYYKRKSSSRESPEKGSTTSRSRSMTPQSDGTANTQLISRQRLLSPEPHLLRSRSATPLPITSSSELSSPTSPLQ